MNDQYAVSAILIIAGIALLTYAPSVGTSGPTLELEEPVSQDEVPADANVVEYESLPPEMQDAFKKALEKDEVTFDGPIPGNLGKVSNEYVHYRGDYYKISFESGDSAGLGGFLTAVVFGGILLIVGTGVALEERKKQSTEK